MGQNNPALLGLRRKVKNATRKEYRNYVKNQCLNITKEFWSFMKSLKKDSSGIPALKDTHKGELDTDNKTKTEIPSKQYQSQFTQERLDNIHMEPDSDIPDMPNITIREDGITKLLKNLKPFKGPYADHILIPQGSTGSSTFFDIK